MASVTKTYSVAGMTCSHCETSVREEIGDVPGVHTVEADFTSGRVTVSGVGFTDTDVTAAVEEAGYTVEE